MNNKKIDSDFLSIKKEYSKFYNEFLKKGKFPMGKTTKGFWGVSFADDIFEIFKRIKLDKYKNFLDLGSGDGKVVLTASLFTKSAGVEHDLTLIKKSLEFKEKLKIDNADFIHDDFFNIDLSEYDIIFINPDKHFYELEKKLSKELRGKLIVYSQIFQPLNLKVIESFELPSLRVYIYSNQRDFRLS